MLSKNSKRSIGMALTASLIAGVAVLGYRAVKAKKSAVSKTNISLKVGKSKRVSIKNNKRNCTYTFRSNRPGVAIVNRNGKITALKKGVAKITVYEIKNGRKKIVGVIKVTVNPIVIKASDDPDADVSDEDDPDSDTSDSLASVVSVNDLKSHVCRMIEPAIEPAFGSYRFDGFTLNGSCVIPMNGLMKYGGKCEVRFRAGQSSGSDKDISIGYSGSKYSKGFDKNGERFVGQSDTITVRSGESLEYSTTLTVDKYMLDCVINLSADAGTDIEISDINVTTYPFDGGDYQTMIDDSLISVGNNSRLKKVINKALAGEHVTLAYLGGSITEGCAATDVSVNSDCYAETSYKEFRQKYGAGDGSNVHFINAGMSGTPSSLGVIRFRNDVLNEMEYGKFPDVLFIEFVVNDHEECTQGEGIESLIRMGLEQGCAVFLVFSHTVNFDTHKQEYYIHLGEKYDLPMVSVKNMMKPLLDPNNTRGCDVSEWFFWNDRLHPDVTGHRFMADMIMNVFDKAYEEEEDPDSVILEETDPVYGDSFTGMTLIDSDVDIEKIDAIEWLSVGSFGDKDSSQNIFQYKKGGKEGVEWFPNCWMHQKGFESFRASVKCSNMMIAYKLANDQNFGKAELYVDGILKETMDGYRSDGWNNATVSVVFKDKDIASHEFEIRMTAGNEDKKFTIYAIGYTNRDEYKRSME